MNNQQSIKWALEVCNQEKILVSKLVKEYQIQIIGC